MEQIDAHRELEADTSQWNDWEHPKTGWNLENLELEFPDKIYDEGIQNDQSGGLSQEEDNVDAPQETGGDTTDEGAPASEHSHDEDAFGMGAPQEEEGVTVGGLSSLAEPSEQKRENDAKPEISGGQEDENGQGSGGAARAEKGKEEEEESQRKGGELSAAAIGNESGGEPQNDTHDEVADGLPQAIQGTTETANTNGRSTVSKEHKRLNEVATEEAKTAAVAAAQKDTAHAVKKKTADDTGTEHNKGNGKSHTENTTGENAVSNENEELDDEVVVDSDEEQVVEKPQKKNGKGKDGKAQKSGIRQFVPLILIVGFVLLAGGAYMLYNMMAGPMQPTPLRRPSAAAPVRSGLERPTAPKPQIRRPSSEESALALADELAAREGAKNEKTDTPVQPRPAASQPQPTAVSTADMTGASSPAVREQVRPRASAASSDDIDNQILAKLKELGVTLDRIEKAVNQKRSALEAQGSVNEDVRESLSSMTQDIQKATKENARLKKELDETRKALEQSYKQIATLKEQANLSPKQRQQAEAAKQKADAKKDDKNTQAQQAAKQGDSSAIKDWQVLGFSGSRVVINNGKSVHSVSVGGTLSGVKILNIDIDSGDIRTSAGTLKYNH